MENSSDLAHGYLRCGHRLALASFNTKRARLCPVAIGHPGPRQLPAIRMESCPPSLGTLPVIAWTAARDQMERCPPSAWKGARDGVEYAKSRRVSCKNAAPATVSRVPLRSRSNSVTPSSSSNSLIARDKGGCSICSLSAARVKCNSSAKTTKHRR
ncbi:hypothetical protein APY03_4113 [Variovorax sp. WDL1]|nr:hypothetical protein APY03_4113 [Variovorax sp. WDL1]